VRNKPSAKSSARKKNVAKSAELAVKRILVPIDFSETSLHALRYALTFARELEASVHLLHVYEPPTFMAGYPTLPIVVPDGQVVQKARMQLDRVAREATDRDVPVECFVRKGKPHQEIVDLAKEQRIDLIVISTHGYTGLKHTLLGSTAERVVRHAGCPVLVVR